MRGKRIARYASSVQITWSVDREPSMSAISHASSTTIASAMSRICCAWRGAAAHRGAKEVLQLICIFVHSFFSIKI